MQDRRVEPRMLCADLVDVQWEDHTGRTLRGRVNLEDISPSGACVQVEHPVPLGSNLRIGYPSGELVGKVTYCIFRETGYFLGIAFEPGSRWSRLDFQPQHLFDPRRLVGPVTNRPRRKEPSSIRELKDTRLRRARNGL